MTMKIKRKLSKVALEEIAVACDYAKERHDLIGKLTWHNGGYIIYDNRQVRELRKHLPHRVFVCRAFFIRYQGECTLFPREMLDTVLNFLNVTLRRGASPARTSRSTHISYPDRLPLAGPTDESHQLPLELHWPAIVRPAS